MRSPTARLRKRDLVRLLVGSTAAVGLAPPASASPARQDAQDAQDAMVDLRTLPGTVVAEGAVDPPAGFYRLRGYRIDEIALPQATDLLLYGQQVSVDRLWRVVVRGGPFNVRALPAMIWLDDQIVGRAQVSPDLSGLVTYTTDSSRLRPGAIFAVSYGWNPDDRVELPEPLAFRGP